MSVISYDNGPAIPYIVELRTEKNNPVMDAETHQSRFEFATIDEAVTFAHGAFARESRYLEVHSDLEYLACVDSAVIYYGSWVDRILVNNELERIFTDPEDTLIGAIFYNKDGKTLHGLSEIAKDVVDAKNRVNALLDKSPEVSHGAIIVNHEVFEIVRREN